MTDEKRDDPTTKQMLDAVPGLRLADRDWRAIASMRHPMKVALWLALMRPAHEVLERAKEGWKPNGEGEDPEVVPESERRAPVPAILALGEAMLARALAGDATAASQIADRIEGKVGQRSGDVDPAIEANRAAVTQTIETLVRAMTANKLGQVVDVDVIDETPIDVGKKQEDNTRLRKPNGKINGH